MPSSSAPIFENRYHVHRWLNVGGQGSLYLVSRRQHLLGGNFANEHTSSNEHQDASSPTTQHKASPFKVIKRIKSLDISRANYIIRECLMVNRMRNGNRHIIEYLDAFLDYEAASHHMYDEPSNACSTSSSVSSMQYYHSTDDSTESSSSGGGTNSSQEWSASSSSSSLYMDGCYVNLEMEWYPLGDLADLLRCCPKRITSSQHDHAETHSSPNHHHHHHHHSNTSNPSPPFWDIRTITTIMHQLCHALSHVHEHKIIHRDLKPSNVLVDYWEDELKADDGSVVQRHRITSYGKIQWDTFNVDNLTLVLCDFGVAHETGFKNSSKANSAVGTELYCSPERIRQRNYSYQSDIWSLGVVFYQLLTGRECVPCFALELLVDRGIAQTIHDEITNQLHYPPIFSFLLLQCLSFEANDRPTSKRLCELFGTFSRSSLKEIFEFSPTSVMGIQSTFTVPMPLTSLDTSTPSAQNDDQSSPSSTCSELSSALSPTKKPIVPHRLRLKEKIDANQALYSFLRSLDDEHLQFAQHVHNLMRDFITSPPFGVAQQSVLAQNGVIHQIVFHSDTYMQRKIIHSLSRVMDLEHRSIILPFQFSSSVKNIRKKIVVTRSTAHNAESRQVSTSPNSSPSPRHSIPQLSILTQRKLSKSYVTAMKSYRAFHSQLEQRVEELHGNSALTPPFIPTHPQFGIDLILCIFYYIPIPELVLHAGLVNRQWFLASYNQRMWKRLTMKFSRGVSVPPLHMLWRDYFVYKVICCLDSVHQISRELDSQRLNCEPLHTYSFQRTDLPHQEGSLEEIVLVENGQEHVFFFPRIRTSFSEMLSLVRYLRTRLRIQQLNELRAEVVKHPFTDRNKFVSFNKIANETCRRATVILIKELSEHDEHGRVFERMQKNQQKEISKYCHKILTEVFVGFLTPLDEEVKNQFLEMQKDWSRTMQAQKREKSERGKSGRKAIEND
mmetsp:Transcript_5906/g.22413  ORF Transcript_5906/g.22413 Transcript_5906/m.22413 type:complete len:953 (-) Transcript_5906:162-3020(-)